MKKIILLFFVLLSLSCKDNSQGTQKSESESKLLELKYAKGFVVNSYGSYNLLEINTPWPNAKSNYKYVLTSKDSALKIKPEHRNFGPIVYTPIQKIVVTSTTHIPALELLGVEQTLVGFPETDYVSSKKTRSRIDNGEIRELGNNEGINTEVLLELHPNLVVAFGVDGTNKSLELIEKSGIPVIYNGDWVEKSPLAKAEWIKFFGLLYNKKTEANSLFNQIETDYLKAKTLAFKATSVPTVLCGAMYKDIWYLPNGASPEAQFLKDANTNYLWSETATTGSLSLSFEVVFNKARDAEFWLSPSYYSSYKDLEASNSHYTEFSAFQNKNIFTFANTKGKTGGVLYYEMGIARPDLVLKDLIKVCHPELLKDYIPTFYKPLE